jgi:high-affinity nickel-transport protein
VNLSGIGFFIVLSFVAAWLISIMIWRIGRFESRFSSGIQETEHTHTELHIAD